MNLNLGFERFSCDTLYCTINMLLSRTILFFFFSENTEKETYDSIDTFVFVVPCNMIYEALDF